MEKKEHESHRHSYTRGFQNSVLSSKWLTEFLLSYQDCISSPCAKTLGSTEAPGSPKDKKLGSHRPKENAEVSVPELCSQYWRFWGHFFKGIWHCRTWFLLVAQQVHRVSHFDGPCAFQNKILPEERWFSIQLLLRRVTQTITAIGERSQGVIAEARVQTAYDSFSAKVNVQPLHRATRGHHSYRSLTEQRLPELCGEQPAPGTNYRRAPDGQTPHLSSMERSRLWH